jgi:hypothetical protein
MGQEILYWPLDKFNREENIIGRTHRWTHKKAVPLSYGPLGIADTALQHVPGGARLPPLSYPRLTVMFMACIYIKSFRLHCRLPLIQIRNKHHALIFGIRILHLGRNKGRLCGNPGSKSRLGPFIEYHKWFDVMLGYDRRQGIMLAVNGGRIWRFRLRRHFGKWKLMFQTPGKVFRRSKRVVTKLFLSNCHISPSKMRTFKEFSHGMYNLRTVGLGTY